MQALRLLTLRSREIDLFVVENLLIQKRREFDEEKPTFGQIAPSL